MKMQIGNFEIGTGRIFIVAEIGMLRRGDTWKIGLNGTGISCYNFIDLTENNNFPENEEIYKKKDFYIKF